MNFINSQLKSDSNFLEVHRNNLAASVQHTIVSILMNRVRQAVGETGIRRVAIAGGVAANSELRRVLLQESGLEVFIPPFEYCTDNAAMIAITGYFKYLKGDFAGQMAGPQARFNGL